MSPTRKLVAIFYTDVAGYSRLTGADEEGTHQRVMAALDGVAETIRSSGGTVLRHAGDAILAVFPSVVGAVTTSASIQTELAERNARVPDDQRVAIRIGLNVGDVIEDRGEVYGDGVNLAARLEAAAEPGGLCISDSVHGQIRRKTELVFEDGGEHHFKNIELPVRVYRWSPDPPEAGTMTSTTTSQTLPFPDKPSIAVLPFTNMSGDPEQEYFADGITEDIITELSRFRDLFVIARNSSFHYKGQSPRIQDVGRELGVRYVVEGSVRKMGPRLRISAQLIEAATGSHLWAERYDRMLEDIFEVQDEVVTAIAGAVPNALGRVAIEQARRKPAVNLTAYDCLLRGRWSLWHSSDDLGVALDWLNRSIEADPGYALAHSSWAFAYAYGVFNLGLEPEGTLARAREHAAKALALEDHDARVHANAAYAYILGGEHQLARTHSERAIALNPNDSEVIHARGLVLNYLGEQREALECFARMQRVDPYGTDDLRLEALTDCLYLAGEYAKLIETYEGWHPLPPHLYSILAAAHAQLGQHDEARAAAAEYERKRRPEHDIRTYVEFQLRMCALQRDRDHWLEGYRKAGFDV